MGFLLTDIFNGIQRNRAIGRAGTQLLNANQEARRQVTEAEGRGEATQRSAQEQGYGAQFDALQGIDQANRPYQDVGQQALMGLGDAANAQTQFKAPSADDIKGNSTPRCSSPSTRGCRRFSVRPQAGDA